MNTETNENKNDKDYTVTEVKKYLHTLECFPPIDVYAVYEVRTYSDGRVRKIRKENISEQPTYEEPYVVQQPKAEEKHFTAKEYNEPNYESELLDNICKILNLSTRSDDLKEKEEELLDKIRENLNAILTKSEEIKAENKLTASHNEKEPTLE